MGTVARSHEHTGLPTHWEEIHVYGNGRLKIATYHEGPATRCAPGDDDMGISTKGCGGLSEHHPLF